jgi:hypothetical protein
MKAQPCSLHRRANRQGRQAAVRRHAARQWGGAWRRARVRDGSPTGARRRASASGSTRSATARPRAAGTRPDLGPLAQR